MRTQNQHPPTNQPTLPPVTPTHHARTQNHTLCPRALPVQLSSLFSPTSSVRVCNMRMCVNLLCLGTQDNAASLAAPRTMHGSHNANSQMVAGSVAHNQHDQQHAGASSKRRRLSGTHPAAATQDTRQPSTNEDSMSYDNLLGSFDEIDTVHQPESTISHADHDR